MRVHPSIIMVPILATLLFATGVQALEPSTDAKTTARSSRADLAQLLPAPTGHRQPTLNDLPPSLREEEEENPSVEAGPTQDSQAGSAEVEQSSRQNGRRRTPRIQPDDGVPRICDPC
jgi:hypothetical protein